ncbi:hypothetical protein ACX80I_01025 [Arthrobacter sp. MDT3-44]
MVAWRYVPRQEAGKTTLFPGFDLWNEVDAELDDYHGYDIRALIRLTQERLEIDQLEILRRKGGPAITGTGIRDLQPPAIVRKSLSALAPDEYRKSVAYGVLSTEEAKAAKASGPTQESIEAVAKVYRSAYAVQSPPTKAVQEVFGLSPRTAGSWIAKARAKGLIPPIGEENA